MEAVLARHPRIAATPGVCGGRPVIRGTRMAVDLILSDLSHGLSITDYLAEFPHLSREDVEAAYDFAADLVASGALAAE